MEPAGLDSGRALRAHRIEPGPEAVSAWHFVVARAAVLGVCGLTIAAFVLRLGGLGQSIFGDEQLLLSRVQDHSLEGMLRAVHDTESTPPFHFLLAWAAAKVGDPNVWIRVPSLVLGAATVPLTYLLGLRTVGRRAALVAAAVMALAPFAVFYGTEGRAYATLGFLSALSTLGLIRAAEADRLRWWVVYAVASCLVLYTHYTGVFVLLAQGAWALRFHRERVRPLLLANAAVLLAYLPWIPSLLVQNDDNASNRIASFAPLSVQSFFRDLLKSVAGHPFVPLRNLPGRIPLAAFLIAVGVGAAAALLKVARERREGARWTDSRGLALVAALAVATPAGLLLYSLAAKSIVIPRNMIASLPATSLLIGWSVTSLRRLPAVAVTAVAMGALCVGTLKAVGDDYQRPPFKDAARFIDARSRPGDTVVDFFFESSSSQVGRELVLNFTRPHRVFRAGTNDAEAWAVARRSGGRVFLVIPQLGPLRGIPRRSGPGRRFPLRAYRIYPGWIPIGVFEYSL